MQPDILNSIDQFDDPSMHFMCEALDLENMHKHFEELRDVLPLAEKYRLDNIDVVVLYPETEVRKNSVEELGSTHIQSDADIMER